PWRAILLYSCLLLLRSCAHCDLHSFPTRRSSDLVDGEQHVEVLHGDIVDQLVIGALEEGGVDRHHRLGTFAGHAGRQGHGVLLRSEEHTSELQSRENLVCRLLLEKKNG